MRYILFSFSSPIRISITKRTVHEVEGGGGKIIVLSFNHTTRFVPNGLVSQIKEGRDVVRTRSNSTSKDLKLHLSVPLHFSLRLSVKAVSCRAEELSRDLRYTVFTRILMQDSGKAVGVRVVGRTGD